MTRARASGSVSAENAWTITPNATVSFDAIIGGQNEACEISFEALKDHFGASSDKHHDLLAAFIGGKTRIHEIARQK